MKQTSKQHRVFTVVDFFFFFFFFFLGGDKAIRYVP